MIAVELHHPTNTNVITLQELVINVQMDSQDVSLKAIVRTIVDYHQGAISATLKLICVINANLERKVVSIKVTVSQVVDHKVYSNAITQWENANNVITAILIVLVMKNVKAHVNHMQNALTLKRNAFHVIHQMIQVAKSKTIVLIQIVRHHHLDNTNVIVHQGSAMFAKMETKAVLP